MFSLRHVLHISLSLLMLVGTFSQVRFLTKIYHPNIDKVRQHSHPTDTIDRRVSVSTHEITCGLKEKLWDA